MVESEEAPEDIRVARGAAAAAAAAVTAVQDYVVTAKEAAVLSLDGLVSNGSTSNDRTAHCSVTVGREDARGVDTPELKARLFQPTTL